MIRNLKINRKIGGFMPIDSGKVMSPPNVCSCVVSSSLEKSYNVPGRIVEGTKKDDDMRVIYAGYRPKDSDKVMLPPNSDSCVEAIMSARRR